MVEQFPIVLRGYDKEKVDEAFALAQETVDRLRDQVKADDQTILELQAQLQEEKNKKANPNSFASLGANAQQMLASAEQTSAELLDRAKKDASAARATVQLQAETLLNNAKLDAKRILDEAKAKEYRDAAIEELTAQGVTFPIKVQLPYNPSTTDWDKQCQVLKQQLEGVLNDGTDFIDIIITAGPSDSFLSAVRRNGKFEFLLCNWGADYSDPETETDPFYQAEDSRGMRYAYLRTGVEDGFITGETADAVMAYMNAIEAAKQITDDIDARYKAFADAEALLITNALVIPRGMSVPAYLATRLNYWEGQYASTGFSNKRLKGIHVLDHYVSMDEYEANRDAR